MRRALTTLAALRAVLSLAAIPLAPFLFREHAAVLVLLRPTKETLLFAGFAAHRGNVSLSTAVLAALPILLGGVWIFFALGREHKEDLARRDLPGVLGRLLPRKRITTLRRALKARGDTVIFLARLAVMPSSLVAAAAGASGFPTRRFLLVDGGGATVSLVVMLGLGWLLDDAYETAGPWLTAGGLAIIVGIAVLIGRTLSRSGAARPAARAAASRR